MNHQEHMNHLRRNPICAHCKRDGFTRGATNVDHIIPPELLPAGDDSYNLQSLCSAHIDEAKRYRWERPQGASTDSEIAFLLRPSGLKRSRIPLTILCGPAAGGKSAYIKQNAGADDIIIDMDAIRHEIGIGDVWSRSTMVACLKRRNEILMELDKATAPRAWFIVSAPAQEERDWWKDALGAEEVIVIAADIRTCINRINKTRKGDRADRSIRAVKRWWTAYTQPESRCAADGHTEEMAF